MRWRRHKILSEEDMTFLAGTELMETLQQNRLIVKYEKDEAQPTFEEIGLFETKGVVYPHFKQNGRRKDTLEILFENLEDMDNVEQHMTHFKMGKD